MKAGSATHVVKLTLSLPLTKKEFTTDKQSKFRESIAAIAGAKPTDVTISIPDRRAGRRLLAESIRVDIIVKLPAADPSVADAMTRALSIEKINEALAKADLTESTLLEAPRLKPYVNPTH